MSTLSSGVMKLLPVDGFVVDRSTSNVKVAEKISMSVCQRLKTVFSRLTRMVKDFEVFVLLALSVLN